MKRYIIIIISLLIIAIAATVAYATFYPKNKTAPVSVVTEQIPDAPIEPPKPLVTHMATPTPVKALYVSSWVASSPHSKAYLHIMELLETTELNAVVIDIKDDTGKVSFLVDDPIVTSTGSPENRIKNINELINDLHAKNIYVIGRVSTFQDRYLANAKPTWALSKKSDGSVWKDRKGLPFLDPRNKDVLTYLVAVGNTAYRVGFDEINYDYIRYPSDGNIKDINYRLTEGMTRADNITNFAQQLHDGLKVQNPDIKISADVFGLTTTETTDMGIGQVFERLLPYFDYIAPMIYPSHYANGEYGIAKPAEHPYETITKALAGAQKKTAADPTQYAKVRPWLQDFSIRGTTYGADKIKAEIKATYDAHLDSWMMWDPSNKYTTGAYEK